MPDSLINVQFFIQLLIFDDTFHQPTRLHVVIDGKVLGIPQSVNMRAQDSCAEGVEGRNPKPPCAVAQGLQTLLHLLRCLVGKGDCQYTVGAHPLLDQMSNTAGQHTGLTATGTRHHQNCTLRLFHALQLLLIQTIHPVHYPTSILLTF